MLEQNVKGDNQAGHSRCSRNTRQATNRAESKVELEADVYISRDFSHLLFNIHPHVLSGLPVQLNPGLRLQPSDIRYRNYIYIPCQI